MSTKVGRPRPWWLVLIQWVLVTLALCAAGLYGCWQILQLVFEPGRDNIGRVHSPDRRADAVLQQVDGGATVAWSYEVWVTLPGEIPDNVNPAARLYSPSTDDPRAPSLKLVWRDSSQLEVVYEKARERWMLRPLVEVDGRLIHVRFRRTSLTP